MRESTNYKLRLPEDHENFDEQAHEVYNYEQIDAILAPTADPELAYPDPMTNGPHKLASWVGWIVKLIKSITGKANWWEVPVKSIQQLSNDTAGQASELAAHKADLAKHIITCTSTTRPATPAAGQWIYETDTLDSMINIGTSMIPRWIGINQYVSDLQDHVLYGYEPLGGVIRIDDNDPRIKYSKGDWRRASWTMGREGLNNYYTSSNKKGASLSFGFIGTGITLSTCFFGNGGQLTASIDSGVGTVIDTYSLNYSSPSRLVTLASGLTFGYHTIIITITGKNTDSADSQIDIMYFDVITTTDSSLKIAKDGVINKSSALTYGNLCESSVDIAQGIDEITQLIPNSDFSRISPTWGTAFQDPFTRADGAAGNGWSDGNIVSNQLVISNTATNGSINWKDRKIKHALIINTSEDQFLCYIKQLDADTLVQAVVCANGVNGYLRLDYYIDGVAHIGTPTTVTINAGTTYYVTEKAKGNIYSLSISTNADYVTGATTIYLYTDGIPNGIFGISCGTHTGTITVDNVIVTAPVPDKWLINTAVGQLRCVTDNIIETTNTISQLSYTGLKNGDFVPVTLGKTYTLKLKRKITSYTSGNGASIRIVFYQADQLTSTGTVVSPNVTSLDSDFVEITLPSGVIPANTAYAYVGGYTDGVMSCQWKDPLFELDDTASGVFHEKESRMDLISLKDDGTIVVTKGTGKDELGYRVEEDGTISKFYRDKDTLPHWDRVKVWRGGTGWNSLVYTGNITYLRSDVTNDTCTISFVGTGIDLGVPSSTGNVVFGVTIDGGTEYLVDSYNATVNWEIVYTIKGLSYGQHQVKIRNTGTYSLGSTALIINYFNIYVPVVPQTPANCQPLGAVLKADPDDGWIRYEEDEGVVYNGTWADDDVGAPSYSGGHVKQNAGTNSAEYGEFSFMGNGVRFIGYKSPSRGILEVLLNSVSKGAVDCYISPEIKTQVVLASYNVNFGLNTIKIKPTNTKNTSATEYSVTIDAFEVKQPLYTIDLRKMLPQGAKDYIDLSFKEIVGDIRDCKIPAGSPGTIIDYINLLKAQVDLAPKGTNAAMTLYVSNTGSDLNPGTLALPMRTIQGAVNNIPSVVNHPVVINVSAGTYNEAVTISGFAGKGYIIINGGTDLATAANFIVSGIISYECSIAIEIVGFKTISTTFPFKATGCLNMQYRYCVSESISPYCLYFEFSLGSCVECQGSNKTDAVLYLASCSTVTSSAWTAGSGNVRGIRARSTSTVGKYSTQPQGTTAELAEQGGVIR